MSVRNPGRAVISYKEDNDFVVVQHLSKAAAVGVSTQKCIWAKFFGSWSIWVMNIEIQLSCFVRYSLTACPQMSGVMMLSYYFLLLL